LKTVGNFEDIIFVMIFGKWNPFGGAMLFDALYCDDDCIRGRAVASGADGVPYECDSS